MVKNRSETAKTEPLYRFEGFVVNRFLLIHGEGRVVA